MRKFRAGLNRHGISIKCRPTRGGRDACEADDRMTSASLRADGPFRSRALHFTGGMSAKNDASGSRNTVLRRLPFRVLYFIPTRALCWTYVAALCLLYIFVYVHIPLSIPMSPHDDMLFIRLGGLLSEGKWFGPYDQFTLMKGPGYPAFLAIVNWLGISVTLAHALFHCAGTLFFVSVCQRFVKSHLLSAVHFALLLWSPILLTLILMRVFRDAIYTDQVLIFLGLFILLLFCAPDAKRGIAFGIASGLTLGWLWLTREEGVWLLPGIAILSIGALIREFRVGRLRAFAAGLAILIVSFAATQAAYRVANRIAYGKFIGVDFKEANYQRTLRALASVLSGGTRHYVSVTKSAREQIYKVSPAFASLSRYLDVPTDEGWPLISCTVDPSSCGEIGAGWFVWALRDAVQWAGHYSSPGRASAFYGQVADEITAACARGALECRPQFIAEMPQFTLSDLAIMPALYVESLNYLLMLNPPLQFGSSFGGHDILFQSTLRFLNYPRYAKRDGEEPHPNYYEISGWYMKSGQDWLTASVRDAVRTVGETRLERRASPDLPKVFPGATDQRFKLNTHCGDDCVLRLDTPDGITVEKRLGELRDRGAFSIPVGAGTFYVENVEVQPDPAFAPHLSERVAMSIREFALTHYKFALVPALALGLAGFLASLVFLRGAITSVSYIVAVACWGLVFTRLTLLVFITATAMPSLHGSYHGPACALLVCASIMSIAAFLQLAGFGPPRAATA